mmetsp:Transcript_17526/g.52592  ORF Transcript_17526/g.52592 Transcript_17526/m.52592 type:complete len:239 (-) Transcript_17526:4397-5113(-)
MRRRGSGSCSRPSPTRRRSWSSHRHRQRRCRRWSSSSRTSERSLTMQPPARWLCRALSRKWKPGCSSCRTAPPTLPESSQLPGRQAQSCRRSCRRPTRRRPAHSRRLPPRRRSCLLRSSGCRSSRMLCRRRTATPSASRRRPPTRQLRQRSWGGSVRIWRTRWHRCRGPWVPPGIPRPWRSSCLPPSRPPPLSSASWARCSGSAARRPLRPRPCTPAWRRPRRSARRWPSSCWRPSRS